MKKEIGGHFMDATNKYNKIQKDNDKKEEEWNRKVLFENNF